MSCPTCGATLELVCTDEYRRRYYHCPCCGTLVTDPELADHSKWPTMCVPKLVDRCRRFETSLLNVGGDPVAWNSFGIAESINTPENRPKI